MGSDIVHPEPMAVHPGLVADVQQLGEAGVGGEGDVPEVETAVLVLADHTDRRRGVVLLLACKVCGRIFFTFVIIIEVTWLELGRNRFQAPLFLLFFFAHHLLVGLILLRYTLFDQIVEVVSQFRIKNCDVARKLRE